MNISKRSNKNNLELIIFICIGIAADVAVLIYIVGFMIAYRY